MPANAHGRPAMAPGLERPRLELSGPKLAQAFETLVRGTEEHGGVEQYVAALDWKRTLFRDALGSGGCREVGLAAFKALCARIATARRRMGPHLEPAAFPALRERVSALLDPAEPNVDARLAAFCAGFPDDRAHRWVRDLAAEILHNTDPERYPLMSRWVWDARANTGVLRELWYGEDVDHILIDIPDRFGTFVVLREELTQFLADNGVFRDVLHYVDLLTAQVYAGYVSEQGGSYLRTDFAMPEDPLVHTRRLLGLDGIDASGRTRLKAFDGTAFVVADPKQLN
ncbi:MAG TPA: hypothetical protein VL742_00940 [Casimicrobiaceae bacterium]|nr:hypothetical protein [Casimicrobiaceae bacterium]